MEVRASTQNWGDPHVPPMTGLESQAKESAWTPLPVEPQHQGRPISPLEIPSPGETESRPCLSEPSVSFVRKQSCDYNSLLILRVPETVKPEGGSREPLDL